MRVMCRKGILVPSGVTSGIFVYNAPIFAISSFASLLSFLWVAFRIKEDV